MRDEILKLRGAAMDATPDELMLLRWRRYPWPGRTAHDLRRNRPRQWRADHRSKATMLNMADGPEASLVAQVAEVEVDDETGEVRVTKLTTAHNTGTILNPLTHQGQIDGAVMMGLVMD